MKKRRGFWFRLFDFSFRSRITTPGLVKALYIIGIILAVALSVVAALDPPGIRPWEWPVMLVFALLLIVLVRINLELVTMILRLVDRDCDGPDNSGQ